jgi:hypothetical protein
MSIRSYEHATGAIALPNSALSRTQVARALRSVEPLEYCRSFTAQENKKQPKRVLAVESRAAEKRGEEREVGSTSSE